MSALSLRYGFIRHRTHREKLKSDIQFRFQSERQLVIVNPIFDFIFQARYLNKHQEEPPKITDV